MDTPTHHLKQHANIMISVWRSSSGAAKPLAPRLHCESQLATHPFDPLQVSHVLLDPLRRDQLACLPLHRFRAAIVLADEGWCGSEVADERYADSKTVSDAIDQPSVLTQDALIVMVQVGANCQCWYAAFEPLAINARCAWP